MGWENKKVLVNGATGFIGSNIIKELLRLGAIIYSIDNFSYVDSDMAKEKSPFLKKVEIIEGDVSVKETWEKVPTDIEYIFHFAAPSSITLFKRTPEKCLNETILGLYYVLEFAKKNNVKKVIYPTSGSNYAGNEMPHKEDIYIKPRNLYAAGKMACEGLAGAYSNFVNSIGLRIFASYGPGEEWKKDFGSVLYLFIKDYLEGKAPEIWGDGEQTRDFIYIEDVVKMIVKSAEIDYTGILNIGTGKSKTFRELLEIIKKTLNTNIEPRYIPKEANYVENLQADTTLMKKFLGIEPMSQEEGIKKFINHLKENK